MITRSISKYLSKKIVYQVDIDFDEASSAWKENKRSIGNGEYEYICVKKMRNTRKCIESSYQSHISSLIANEEI